MFRRDPIARSEHSVESPSCGVVSAGFVSTEGKFFSADGARWIAAGLTYGPFAPNRAGEPFPSLEVVRGDLAQMVRLGANCIRLYHLPPTWLLEEAHSAGLKLFIDVPWEKHRCFFEDYAARQQAIRSVASAAKQFGTHPATFAISVANEIPKDIVRFYGAARVERFIGELIHSARQQAPECLLTYTNYPSTEFLAPGDTDFLCFNVYLHESEKLGRYLDRLHHIAGSKPLVLGELGFDSLRHGQEGQAKLLAEQLRCAARRGVAGSFVFSFTDDWFTGGHAIENWAFGVTDRGRAQKPAAVTLHRAWTGAREPAANGTPLPRVSVVVCSYNGAATLAECLFSLTNLDYPDYEVILVDDGSTDQTTEIAKGFPSVRCVKQENRGLSIARNVGAELATGRVVAYTDSDCLADPMWLRFLITRMMDQKVDAIGGPNIPPPHDGPIPACVAASPGGPSHVMIDDRYAEHVPGCNMAFKRDVLLGLGGFDPQFRVAGDDVDICWRLLDAGKTIGFSSAALVWHHRRNTIGAYLRQQKGYGRAEGMLYFKHPQRFNAVGQARWNGVLYGDGAVGLPLARQPIWHGRFGLAPFQVLYSHNQYSLWAWPLLLEWHMVWLMLFVAGLQHHLLAGVAVSMALLSLIAAIRSAWRAAPRGSMPLRYRLVVLALYVLQPIVRGVHRSLYRLQRRRVPEPQTVSESPESTVKRISFCQGDLYFQSTRGVGREELLESLVSSAREARWDGVFDAEWETWDVALFGGWWWMLYLRTASEQLGGPRVFTRVRCALRFTRLSRCVLLAAASLIALSAWARQPAVAGAIGVLLVGALSAMAIARIRCWRAFAAIAHRAGRGAGLETVSSRATASQPVAESVMSNELMETTDVVPG